MEGMCSKECQTFVEGMKHWPFGFAVLVARRAISIFLEIPALAVHPVASHISCLITEAICTGSWSSKSVTSKNASSQLTAYSSQDSVLIMLLTKLTFRHVIVKNTMGKPELCCSTYAICCKIDRQPAIH